MNKEGAIPNFVSAIEEGIEEMLESEESLEDMINELQGTMDCYMESMTEKEIIDGLLELGFNQSDNTFTHSGIFFILWNDDSCYRTDGFSITR